MGTKIGRKLTGKWGNRRNMKRKMRSNGNKVPIKKKERFESFDENQECCLRLFVKLYLFSKLRPCLGS